MYLSVHKQKYKHYSPQKHSKEHLLQGSYKLSPDLQCRSSKTEINYPISSCQQTSTIHSYKQSPNEHDWIIKIN